MRKALGVLALGAAAVTMLVAAPTATAATDPGTFAIARDGNLTVASSVLVTARRVEMMGGWFNTAAPCSQTRRLDVEILIDRVRGGNTTRFTDEVSARMENCAEGGPNLGFQLRAADVGMALSERQMATRALLLRHRYPPPGTRPQGHRQPLLHREGSLLERECAW